MRISGGQARGTRLKVPAGARPASERVRQAAFSALGDRVEGARVLDLYCGSGAYGLEALSRGASAAVLVDSDRRALSTAAANAGAAGFAERATVVRRDVDAYLRSASTRRSAFDLVFCDPPYADEGAVSRVLPLLGDKLAHDARVVVEVRRSSAEAPEVDGYTLVADRRYGDTRVLTYSLEGA